MIIFNIKIKKEKLNVFLLKFQNQIKQNGFMLTYQFKKSISNALNYDIQDDESFHIVGKM